MKSFPAHLKAFEVVYDRRKKSGKSPCPKTKCVKITLQVPSSNRRLIMSIASRLSKHFDETWGGRYLTVIHPFGAEMTVIRAAKGLLEAHAQLNADPNSVRQEHALACLGALLDAVRELPTKEMGLV